MSRVSGVSGVSTQQRSARSGGSAPWPSDAWIVFVFAFAVASSACRDPQAASSPQTSQGWQQPQPGWQPQPPQPLSPPPPQGGASLPDAQSARLADRINAYRQSRGLPPVPRSRALGIVAMTHARDLAQNYRGGSDGCNLHSWGPGTNWQGCCYTSDHARATCMWNKPKELAGFPAKGYEVSAFSSGAIDADGAVQIWQGSPGHNAVILSQGTWASRPWRSLGAAIYGGFAVAWFAEEADGAGGY